jgi:peptidoglycan/xylan/chitin deacetylase (PgdA/CDA1 family)
MNARTPLLPLGAMVAALLLLAAPATFAQQRQVAITIDDLPRGGDGGPVDTATLLGMTGKLLAPLREQKIPVTGFVNAGRKAVDPRSVRRILDLWLDAGADLGNHSFSHPDINDVPLAQYTADIVKGEPELRAALQARDRKLTYFRHPYLRLGATAEVKKGLQDFLDARGYVVAPVTLDNADYLYAALYQRPEFREQARREYLPYMESVVEFFEKRSVEVLGREFPQILLIHANQLNADVMPELLAMFKRRGYRIITLAEALKDPAYRSSEQYVGRGGFSWIHRWSKTMGMPGKGEPEPPAWAQQAWDALSR